MSNLPQRLHENGCEPKRSLAERGGWSRGVEDRRGMQGGRGNTLIDARVAGYYTQTHLGGRLEK